jgi:hypothetical protein
MGDHSLACVYVNHAVALLDPQGAVQHHGKFFKFRGLAGFLPASGAAHMGDAGCAGGGIYSSDIFVNQLGFVASGLDPRRLGD